jgi:hypothetical protein
MSASLDSLMTLPETRERDRQELALHLGPLLIATKGFAAPEVENADVEP